MSQKAKLVASIRNNPTDVRFDDACKVAEWMHYVPGSAGGGSHVAYSRPGDPVGLNFQNRNGKIPPYQARQLIAALDKYEDQI